MIKSSIGKKSNQRRTVIGFPNNNSSTSESKGRQIYDHENTSDLDTVGTNSSSTSDKRKHTVLRITFIKRARNQTAEPQRVLLVGNNPKDDSSALLRTSPQKVVQDTLQDTTIPITFHVNRKPVNLENLPINKLLSDKPFPNNQHDFNTSSALQHPQILKPPEREDKPESNVVLEAKLNPIRIGIRLDGNKKNEAKENSKEVSHVSLQDVLNDIGDSSKTIKTTDKSRPENEESVVIDLNDNLNKGNKPTMKQTDSKESDGKLGRVHLKATSHKDSENGTEVETAGVSITTESKGLQTNGLMKILLSKLLGSDISQELKGKVADELKSIGRLKKPNDEASTAAQGSLVESPPGTIQGVDTAEMNNAAGEQPPNPATVPPPSPPPTAPPVFPNQPGCGGILNPAVDKVTDNSRLPGGSDCSYGMQWPPNAHAASSAANGMLLESPPGTIHGVGTGIPSPAAALPSPFSRLSSNGGMYASSDVAGQGIMAAGTNTGNGFNGIQRGDYGKIK